jgi:hypothetical protein
MNKFHVLRDKDPEVLKQKAEALMAQWEEMWQRKQERDREAGMKQLARDAQDRNKEQKALLAETKTAEAEQEVRQLETVLKRVIGLDTEIHIGLDTEIQWDRLKDHQEFPTPQPAEPYFPLPPFVPDPEFPPAPQEPVKPHIPEKPIPPDLAERPRRDESRFSPTFSLLESMIPGRVQKKEAEALFQKELAVWNEKIRTYNEHVAQYNDNLLKLKQSYKEAKEEYRRLKPQYEEDCRNLIKEHNALKERRNREHESAIE